ncbi:MAG: hypothetical protein ND895_08310 [Pyrinomonadaceae bacterium]|nr:hypothetical protein [Pyrinomonadaceae bacterium]
MPKLAGAGLACNFIEKVYQILRVAHIEWGWAVRLSQLPSLLGASFRGPSTGGQWVA